MPLARRIIKGSIWIYFFFFFQIIFNYFVRVFYSRELSIENYGLFYAIIGFFAFIAIFNDLGLAETLMYFIPQLLAKKDFYRTRLAIFYALGIQITTAVIISAIIFWKSKTLAILFFHTEQAIIPLKILSVYFIFFNLSVTFNNILRGYQKEKYYAFLEFLNYLLILTASIFVLYFSSLKSKIIIFSFSWLIVSIILNILYLLALRKFICPFFKKIKLDKTFFKKLMHYAFPLMVGAGVTSTLHYTDTILLTLIRGVKDVGFYSVAFPLASITVAFVFPFARFLFPLVSELHHKKEKKKLKDLIEKIYSAGLFFFTPSLFVLLIFPKEIIDIFFSAKYMDASLALQILAMGFIFNAFNVLNINIISGIGEPETKAKIIGIGAISNIIFDIILIPILGYTGAAIGFSLGCFFMFLSSSVFIFEKSILKIKLKTVLKTLIFAFVFLFVIFALKNIFSFNPYLKGGITIFIGGIIYFFLGIKYRLIEIKKYFNIHKNE